MHNENSRTRGYIAFIHTRTDARTERTDASTYLFLGVLGPTVGRGLVGPSLGVLLGPTEADRRGRWSNIVRRSDKATRTLGQTLARRRPRKTLDSFYNKSIDLFEMKILTMKILTRHLRRKLERDPKIHRFDTYSDGRSDGTDGRFDVRNIFSSGSWGQRLDGGLLALRSASF